MYILGQERDLTITKNKILKDKEEKTLVTLNFTTRSLPFFCNYIVDDINSVDDQWISVDQTVDLNREEYTQVSSKVQFQIILPQENDNVFSLEKNITIPNKQYEKNVKYIQQIDRKKSKYFEEQQVIANDIMDTLLYKYSFYLRNFYLYSGDPNNEFNKLLLNIYGISKIEIQFGKQVALSNNINNKFISNITYDDKFLVSTVNLDENNNSNEYINMLKTNLPYIKEVNIGQHTQDIQFSMYLFERIQNFEQKGFDTLISW